MSARRQHIVDWMISRASSLQKQLVPFYPLRICVVTTGGRKCGQANHTSSGEWPLTSVHDCGEDVIVCLHREPYQFMLPDYMVHRPYKPKTATDKPVCPSAPSGVPYHNPLIMEHEGRYIFYYTKLLSPVYK